MWGYKDKSATPEFKDNLVRWTRCLPTWDRVFDRPRDLDEIFGHLPKSAATLRRDVEAVFNLKSVDWVERSDVMRCLALRLYGGLMIDCCDVFPHECLMDCPVVAQRKIECLRACEFVVANGNTVNQYIECDIVVSHAHDRRLLEVCKEMVRRLLGRRRRSRFTGPLYTVVGAWLSTGKRLGFQVS